MFFYDKTAIVNNEIHGLFYLPATKIIDIMTNMPGSENQVVKIRLVAEGNQIQNESNFYYLENSTARPANRDAQKTFTI